MHRTKVKICCIASLHEARAAIAAGADAIGLVGKMPSGPGVINDDLAREIATSVRGQVETFLLSSRETADDTADHVEYCSTGTVQIVKHIAPGEHAMLSQRLPGIRRVQVVHVENVEALELALRYEPHVDALLLDSGRPYAEVTELGGTGRVHDWQLSAEIVRRIQKPVYLAGGLNPENARLAIESVRPYGLDLCSGVRTHGILDEQKLGTFMRAVNQADSQRLQAALTDCEQRQ